MHTSALQARPLLCVSSLAPSQFIQGGAQRLSFGDQDKESTVNNCNVRADAERNVSSKEIAMKIRHILIACVLITGAPLAYADLTCRADSFGNTRCSDGTTYRTDSFGTTRDNRGNTWRTDSLEQPAVAMALRTAEIHLEQPEIIGAILGAPIPSVQRVVVTERFAVQTPSAPCAATEYITDRSCWPTNVLARTLLCSALYCFTEPVH